MSEHAPSILLGAGTHPATIQTRMINRHGLIAGATGTGKTVTLQVLAEQFARLGTPVFVADIKGDLSGIAASGKPHPKISARAEKMGLEPMHFQANPVIFWDVHGEKGHPFRLTISEIGPVVLARLLGLNELQEDVLNMAFQIADDQGLLLLDFKDFEALLRHLDEAGDEYQSQYGRISSASLGAIMRAVTGFKREGAEQLFGEPAIALDDLLIESDTGAGMIHVLAADRLYRESPKVYAALLLWLLSELFEQMPEVGDLDAPKFVLFFDEAHLLFDDAPKPLIDKIEQVVRLVRSKGVGVYFVTQNPLDLPETVLGQLGNRVQHALRAFTPRDQKAVRAAAQTFRSNEAIDVETVITQLGVGEALISCLDAKGMPTPVEQVLMRPPMSRIGPLTDEERAAIMQRSRYRGRFDTPVDRDSAFEMLKKRTEEKRQQTQLSAQNAQEEKNAQSTARTSRRQTPLEAFISSTVRAIGSQIGRQLIRSLLGSLKR
ncbi:MAG: ATP-binding protein [Halothiobacillus sp. 14-56-357]|jgi:DNA helicase HerA-like ATPase|uniref:helicase HerA-like domain-containing protein n=1 Tax=Halothiobacillus sp. 15-55-196 TaxID=1970382 RepID=UPI000BD150AF|nr:helicase HerA-like domain-containing protein [Halothiobacillus sp. 15-55-196]OZB37050.1 MAG: ATP-binding protein [Halothiobacillus sp. 15-55-196]OZB56952.1 MAG: ATP-binding protein [Halothiobacillus sp. 14-56-357]OZB77807.1 MAG: ATP-binding protein [Halothiobacillus sp. 13-55-115]